MSFLGSVVVRVTLIFLISTVAVASGSAQCEQSESDRLVPSQATDSGDFGESCAIDGDTMVIGAIGEDGGAPTGGAAYVYRWNGSAWIEQQRLIATDDESVLFGWAVAISGDVIVIGDPLHEPTYADGRVHVYRFDGALWQEEVVLYPDDIGQGLGESIAVDGDVIAAGASLFDGDAGAVYVWRWDGADWQLDQSKLTESNPASQSAFGGSVALEQGHFADRREREHHGQRSLGGGVHLLVGWIALAGGAASARVRWPAL